MDNSKVETAKLSLKERLAELAKAVMLRKKSKFMETHELMGYVADPNDPTKPLRTRHGNPIAVHRYTGWDRGSKYTGAKLRQIRREQALQAIAGKTHYNDGTEIKQDLVVDLWPVAA